MTATTRFTSTLLAAALAAATAPLLAQRAPAATPTNLPPETLSLACAPTLTYEDPATNTRITGGQDSTVRYSHAPGDLVVLNKGSEDGLQVGQEFFVRRVYVPGQRASRISRENPATVRTAGWIKVYAVDPKMALATVSYACDSIEADDYLEPFVLPQVPVASTSHAKPDKNYAHVMTGADRRRSFAKGDYFVLDRGSDQGIRPGAQFVVYRNKHELNVQQPDVFLYELGEAVAVDVKNDRSTLLVTLSRDAFTEGDLVAMRPE
jgi:hypothetical protein